VLGICSFAKRRVAVDEVSNFSESVSCIIEKRRKGEVKIVISQSNKDSQMDVLLREKAKREGWPPMRFPVCKVWKDHRQKPALNHEMPVDKETWTWTEKGSAFGLYQ
jgi:hypothetical protein